MTQICEYYGTAMNALSLLKQEDSIIIDCGMKNSHVSVSYFKTKMRTSDESSTAL